MPKAEAVSMRTVEKQRSSVKELIQVFPSLASIITDPKASWNFPDGTVLSSAGDKKDYLAVLEERITVMGNNPRFAEVVQAAEDAGGYAWILPDGTAIDTEQKKMELTAAVEEGGDEILFGIDVAGVEEPPIFTEVGEALDADEVALPQIIPAAMGAANVAVEIPPGVDISPEAMNAAWDLILETPELRESEYVITMHDNGYIHEGRQLDPGNFIAAALTHIRNIGEIGQPAPLTEAEVEALAERLSSSMLVHDGQTDPRIKFTS